MSRDLRLYGNLSSLKTSKINFPLRKGMGKGKRGGRKEVAREKEGQPKPNLYKGP